MAGEIWHALRFSMSLKLLLDENLRFSAVWQAIAAHQATGQYPLDIVRIGDPGCLPLGARDDEILDWAAGQQRVLISLDASTLGTALARRLAVQAGSPGIILIRDGLSVVSLVELLLLITHASEAQEWENTLRWLP